MLEAYTVKKKVDLNEINIVCCVNKKYGFSRSQAVGEYLAVRGTLVQVFMYKFICIIFPNWSSPEVESYVELLYSESASASRGLNS